jgi:hypothetical protein
MFLQIPRAIAYCSFMALVLLYVSRSNNILSYRAYVETSNRENGNEAVNKNEKDFLKTLEEAKIIEKKILPGIDHRSFCLWG